MKLLKDVTEQECREFQRKHPDLRRYQVERGHNLYYRAMKLMGLLDELYPRRRRDSKIITLEQCEQFKRDHPELNRQGVLRQYAYMHWAMERLGCFDRLFPSQNADFNYQSAEELIEIARQYQSVRDMKCECPDVLVKIYHRGLKKEALKHMKPMGDRKHKYIYAFEFPDHSVYIGLSYDIDRRRGDHMRDEHSAVLKHIQETGLQPAHKRLTDRLTAEQAQRMEGEWEERYRSEGWTILNVAPTGGLGGIPLKAADRKAVIDLYKQGLMAKDIAQRLGISMSTVSHITKREGLTRQGMRHVPVEVLDDEGRVISTFPSVNAAAEHYGMQTNNLRNQIKFRYRVRGNYVRYNPERYEARNGHPFVYHTPPKKKHRK